MYVYVYIYIYAYTHTYIYIYMCILVCDVVQRDQAVAQGGRPVGREQQPIQIRVYKQNHKCMLNK